MRNQAGEKGETEEAKAEWTARKASEAQAENKVSRKEAAAEIESDGIRKEIADEIIGLD